MIKKNWLPDVKNLIKIVEHQKFKIKDQEWIIHNLINTIDKIREDECPQDKQKENNLN
jgi:hypothetical protein|tara:strand:- start:192 stop:365 length:174 start_codon:yes stop_codon:yes gene_type:complete